MTDIKRNLTSGNNESYREIFEKIRVASAEKESSRSSGDMSNKTNLGCRTCYAMGQKCPVCLLDDKTRPSKGIGTDDQICAIVGGRRKLSEIGIGKRFYDANFDNYICSTDAMRKSLELCVKYSQKILAGEYANIVLCGNVGTGKTHLSTAIVKSFIGKLKKIARVDLCTIVDEIKSSWGNKNASDISVIKRYASYNFLMIEEVGIQANSELEARTLFRIVNARYEAMKPTGFTSNLKLNEFTSIVGNQITDRLNEDKSLVLFFDWPSHRSK